jgi:hypothetical protein
MPGSAPEHKNDNNTTQIIAFPKRVTTDEYFGGCPTCGKSDGYLNAGRSHWFACAAHKVRWCVGANLFGDWRDETEEEQRRKFRPIEDFAEVEPIYPKAGR